MIAIPKLEAVRTIVTHANCPDGAASALILADALPDAPEILFMSYGTPELDALEARPGMLFCDFTPPAEPERLVPFVEAGAIVLDHHRSARSVVEAFGEDGVFADEELEPGVSGAVLAFREVWLPMLGKLRKSDTVALVDNFAVLAGIRDTWQTKHPHWKEACEMAEALRFFPTADLAVLGWNYRFTRLRDVGALLFAKKLEKARRAVDRAYRFYSVGELCVAAFNGYEETSDAADMFDEEVQLVIGFTYLVDSSGARKMNFSLRSRGKFDCGAMAKHFKGGGHRGAGGFTLPSTDEDMPPWGMLRWIVASYLNDRPLERV